MDIKQKLIKAMIEESINSIHGYAYGPACTFKTKDEVLDAEKQLSKEINFDNIDNSELVLDF